MASNEVTTLTNVTMTNGSATVTKNGSNLSAEHFPGDMFTVNGEGESYFIDRITDANNFVLDRNYTGTTSSTKTVYVAKTSRRHAAEGAVNAVIEILDDIRNNKTGFVKGVTGGVVADRLAAFDGVTGLLAKDSGIKAADLIKKDGTVAFTGAVDAAAAGIYLGANDPANLLTDYEIGTWTPVLNFGGATTGIAYTTQAGTYLKVGTFVLLQCEIVLSSKGTATGSASVSGLPFAVPSAKLYFPGQVSCVSGFSGLAAPSCRTMPGPIVRMLNQGVSGIANMTDTSFGNTANFKISIAHAT